MKRIISIFAQFLLFLCVDATGSIFYHPFHLQTSLTVMASAPRSFIWDGVMLMLLLYGALLVVAATRKRIGTSAPTSTFALGLATLVGYLLKFGFITHNW